MKYLPVVVLMLIAAPVLADPFKFSSLADRNQCIGRHISSISPISCSSSSARLQSGEFTCGGGFGMPIMCAGRLKFYATSLCLHADSSTSVVAAPCSSSSRQRWHFSYGERNIWSDGYGSGVVLRYNINNDAIILSNTGLTTSTRRWTFD